LFSFAARYSGGPRKLEGSGDTVEVLGHPEVGIIDDVVGAVAPPVAQRRNAGGGQIVGVNVVGEHVVGFDQRRQALAQAFHRQAVGGIDAGDAQDGDGHAGPPSPGTQAAFGIEPAAGARTLGIDAARLVDLRPAAIAVDAGGANVDQASW